MCCESKIPRSGGGVERRWNIFGSTSRPGEFVDLLKTATSFSVVHSRSHQFAVQITSSFAIY